MHPKAIAHFSAGQELRRAGDLARAAREFEQALAADQRLAEARLELAEVRVAQGDPAGAETLVRQVLDADPGQLRALTVLGAIFAATERPQLGLAAYLRVLERHPDAEPALRGAVDLLEHLGDAARAIVVLKRLRALSPDDPLLALRHARLARALGRRDEAELLLSAIAPGLEPPRPGDVEEAVAIDRAGLLGDQGRPEAAWEVLATALQGRAGSAPLEEAAARLAADQALAARTGERPDAAIAWWRRYLTVRPRDVRALEVLGELYLRIQRDAEAEVVFGHLAKHHPEVPAGGERLAALHARAGAWERAGQVLDAVLERHPQAARARALRAEVRRARGDTEGELADLRVLVGLQPDRADARLRLARLDAARGDDDRAWGWLAPLLPAAQAGDEAVRAPVLALAAERALAVQAASPASAIAWWRRFLEIVPDDPRARRMLGDLLAATGQPAPAPTTSHPAPTSARPAPATPAPVPPAPAPRRGTEADHAVWRLEQAATEAPDDLPIRLQAMRLHAGRGDWEAALEHAEALLVRDPNHAEARELSASAIRWLAEAADEAGDAEAALAWWHRAHLNDPRDRAALLALGDGYLAQGEVQSAVDVLREAVALEPHDPGPALRLAQALVDADQADEARSVLKGLATLHAEQAGIVYDAARLLGELDRDAALELVQRVLRLDPRHAGAKVLGRNLAITAAEGAVRRGDLAAAARAWDLHLKLEPGHVASMRALAEASLRLDDPLKAEQLAHALLDRDPADLDALRLLGRAYQGLGLEDLALKVNEDIVDQAPQDVPALLALADAAMQRQQPMAAMTFLSRVLALEPGQVAACLAMARLFVEQGEPNEGFGFVVAALSAHPRDAEARAAAWAIAHAQGARARDAGQLRQAISWWRQLLPLLAAEDLDRPRLLADLAEALEAEGDAPGALAAYEELAGLAPGELSPALGRARTLEAVGRTADARAAYQQVLAGDLPARAAAEARVSLVRLSLSEGNLALARTDLDALLAVEPAHRWGRLRLAEVLAADAAGDVRGRAFRLVADLVAEVPPEDEPPTLGDEAFGLALELAGQLARTAWAAGDRAGAIGWWEEALAVSPMDLGVLLALGEAYVVSGMEREAEAPFMRVLELEPLHPDALLAVARLAWSDRDPERAWEFVAQVLDLRDRPAGVVPLALEVASARAEQALQRQDPQGALRWWQTAAELAPEDVTILRAIADTHLALQDTRAALRAFRRLAALTPGDPDRILALAEACWQGGAREEAEEALAQLRRQHPHHVPTLRFVCRRFMDAGDARKAAWVQEAAYDLLEELPTDEEALLAAGWAHSQLLERSAAVQTYRQLVACHPRHAEAWHRLAQACLDLGSLEEGLKAATTSLYHDARRPETYLTLGRIYDRLGRMEEAVAAWSQALQLAPDHPDALAHAGFGCMALNDRQRAKGHLVKAIALLPADSELAISVRCALDLL